MVAEFDLLYQSDDIPKFPVDALLIVEYDRNIKDMYCGGLYETWSPFFYSYQNTNSKISSFKIERDYEEWSSQEIHCRLFKHRDKEIENDKIVFSIYPFNSYIDEDMALIIGTEDEYYNLKTKKIFEKEISVEVKNGR